MKKLFMLLFIAVIALAACGTEESKKGTYETIAIDQIEEKVKEGYKVVDVREFSEYATGHIVGAANKPLTELQKSNFELLSKEDSYIIICQSGNRSKQASEILVEEGYTVLNVSEGMSSWTGEIEK
ncbi:rhodanese-like domain-containing protein [Psychrobacillus sp.]|uniref:rhodanese-like domain-containing protein n=1 Tax=Psychrobacillus sp. TaxID=1871623 RepID=UPI0028BD32D6|nr:rhodanese-like domain-containing protein [Psychrobacillus sp.]